jgi:RNA polymerase sigma-70 factor (ECF subfamily)
MARERNTEGTIVTRDSESERREAFEAEMLPHLNAAYRLARVLTRQEQDAEDLVQEAYLRAFAAFRDYTRGTHARAWLLTILRHIYLNERRRERSRPLLLAIAHPGEAEEIVDQTSPGPEDQAVGRLDDKRVLDVAELPESFRSVLALVDLEGMRYAEAAAILDCPIGTVMSRLHRGRLELARRLQLPQSKREAG